MESTSGASRGGRAIGNTLIDIGDTGIDSVAIDAPNERITIAGNELYNARIGFSGTRYIHIASNKLVGESWIYMGYFAGENDFVIISNNFIDTVHKYAMYLEGEHIVVNGNVIIHRKPNAMSFYLSIGNIEIINNFVFFPSVFIKLRYSSEGLLNVCCNSIYAVPGERLVVYDSNRKRRPAILRFNTIKGEVCLAKGDVKSEDIYCMDNVSVHSSNVSDLYKRLRG